MSGTTSGMIPGKVAGGLSAPNPSFAIGLRRDGTAGPSGTDGFIAEPHRYHLYVSYACPWAHRTLIFRALKGLEHMISVSVVDHYMGADGWTFLERDGSTP